MVIRKLTQQFVGLNDEIPVHKEREFDRIINKERLRAERNGSVFSMVVFDWEDQTGLAEHLGKRLRLTDEIGIVKGRVAAILPDTEEFGARILAEDVCESVGDSDSRPTYRIYLFPDEQLDKATTNRQVDTKQETESLEMLMIQRMPVWKRTLDIVGASAGLIVLSPILLLTAIAIRLTSRGPVFFTQMRRGLGGRPFKIYKFRSMVVDAEAQKAGLRKHSEQDGPAFKMKKDPRITRLGRFLRKSCIDELPQLWNVLIGDMSLVGPRPLPCDESDKCTGWERRRLQVTPGLTCIWQVSGKSRVSFTEWMRMDIRYINGRTFFQDLRLLYRTFIDVVLHRASH